MVTSLAELVETKTKFPTIYADPPWQYENSASRASACSHYKTMPLDAICAMPVCLLAAENAHLHLWASDEITLDEIERIRI